MTDQSRHNRHSTSLCVTSSHQISVTKMGDYAFGRNPFCDDGQPFGCNLFSLVVRLSNLNRGHRRQIFGEEYEERGSSLSLAPNLGALS